MTTREAIFQVKNFKIQVGMSLNWGFANMARAIFRSR